MFAEKTIAEIYSRAPIYEGNPSAEEVAQRIARLPLAGHPGEIFVYGLSFDVLARVLEVASGQPLDDFISERLLEPLGMEDTFFAVPEDKLHRFSNSYDITGPGSLQAVTRADHMARWRPGWRFLSPNSGMVSTVSDYLRFAQMMLGGGELDGVRIVSRKTIDLITATVVENAELGLIRPALPGYGYSLGFGVLENVAESGKPGSPGQYEWAGWGRHLLFCGPQRAAHWIVLHPSLSGRNLRPARVADEFHLPSIDRLSGKRRIAYSSSQELSSCRTMPLAHYR